MAKGLDLERIENARVGFIESEPDALSSFFQRHRRQRLPYTFEELGLKYEKRKGSCECDGSGASVRALLKHGADKKKASTEGGTWVFVLVTPWTHGHG